MVQHNSVEDEIDYWKKRCLAVEAKVEQHLSQVEGTTNSKDKGCSSCSGCSDLLKEAKAATQGFMDLDEKYLSLKEEICVDRQYSRRNNGILEGYKRLPNLSNLEFICAAVR